MIRTYLPWLLSAITIWMTVLAGNKHRSAWAVGLGNQLLWLIWIIVVGAWGLLPMNIALWIVYGRNHFKWNRPTARDFIDVANAAIEEEAWRAHVRTGLPPYERPPLR